MKSLFYLKSLRDLVSFSQIRFYRGKHLTSYQKRISNDEKKLQESEIIKEPLNIIVSESLKINCSKEEITTKKNIELNNLKISESLKITSAHKEEITKKNIELNNLESICQLYCSSNDEYRKLILYGSENREVTETQYNCHGCGSNINCSSVYNPGYIPYEVYEQNRLDENFMKHILCIRCFYLENNLNPLDISLDEDLHRDILLKKINQCESATVILLADMTDLPWSIPPDFSHSYLSSPHIRLIIVGNKLDLVSNDKRLLEFFKQQLLEAAKNRGIFPDKISFIELISALDCTGIDALIDRIISQTFYKNEPIFIIGSTNSGKSTFFNRLLKSDICKSIAKSNIGEAVVSNWPGTTLNVLRFPMVNVSNRLISRRMEAKLALSRGDYNIDIDDSETESAEATTNCKPLLNSDQMLKGKRDQIGEELSTYSYSSGGEICGSSYDEVKMRRMYDNSYCDHYDEEKITTKKWCYDTPGFINTDQIINYLPKDQLDSLSNRKQFIKPRIYILKSGLSIIMQNLARLDIIEAPQHVYISVHGVLPVEIVVTDDVERYFIENDHIIHYSFKKNLSKPLLDKIRSKVPLYDPVTDLIPDMTPLDMEFRTTGYYESSGDVVLSSIGWVGVSGVGDGVCKVRAWTPASIGCGQRTPSMVPNAVKRRSHRKSHSREFTID